MKLKKEVREYFLKKEKELEYCKNDIIGVLKNGDKEKGLLYVTLLNAKILNLKKEVFCFYNQHQINGEEYLKIKKNVYFIECAIYREINIYCVVPTLDVSIDDFLFNEPIRKRDEFIKEYLKDSEILVCDFKY